MDIQTSGLFSTQHQILGIGVIKCSNRFEKQDELSIRILRDNYYVSPKAVAKNGVDLRDTTGWVSEDVARKAIFSFLGAEENVDTVGFSPKRYTITGMNIGFDMPFIKAFLTERAYNKIFHYVPFDVLGTYDFLYRIGVVTEPESRRAADIAKSLGIDYEFDKLDMGNPIFGARFSMRVARRVSLLTDCLAQLVADKGYSVKGLLHSDVSLAKTKNSMLIKARKKLLRFEAEDTEDEIEIDIENKKKLDELRKKLGLEVQEEPKVEKTKKKKKMRGEDDE